jgi:hypothetical protein
LTSHDAADILSNLSECLDEWEAEHGAFTEEELSETAEKLGWPWRAQNASAMIILGTLAGLGVRKSLFS